MQPIHSSEHPIQIFKSPRCSRARHFARIAAVGGVLGSPSRASDFIKAGPELLAACWWPARKEVFGMNDNAPAGR